MHTWDDIPGWIEEHVTDRQREVVNRMRRQGYEMGNVWPDLNYEALDRIIFCMERKPREGQVERAFVDTEAKANGKELDVYLSGAPDVVKKDPPVIHPAAPDNYELTPVDMGFLREHSGRMQEALACLRLAAAINGGPPWALVWNEDGRAEAALGGHARLPPVTNADFRNHCMPTSARGAEI